MKTVALTVHPLITLCYMTVFGANKRTCGIPNVIKTMQL